LRSWGSRNLTWGLLLPLFEGGWWGVVRMLCVAGVSAMDGIGVGRGGLGVAGG
jgi:hypothetical protein